jgi:hypothetical protein
MYEVSDNGLASVGGDMAEDNREDLVVREKHTSKNNLTRWLNVYKRDVSI